ncbi:MAG: hypothetical protein P4M01_08145 [Acidobacteriota bacterium]|nr:hypothetical protein [Acidobacteriota bacterium]
MNFQEQYAKLSDEELLHIAGDRRDLLEEARFALGGEMAQRGLTLEQAHRQKRHIERMTAFEDAKHHPQPKDTKYFVARNKSWLPMIVAFAVPILGMALLAVSRVPDVWWLPTLASLFGLAWALLYLQPWVKKTISFWFCIAISCAIQFISIHWLDVHYPALSNASGKGQFFLGILAGWAVGGALFLILQRFKPKQETESTGWQ